eukprot:2964445-Lingulodinium_polyedra.AAC.1
MRTASAHDALIARSDAELALANTIADRNVGAPLVDARKHFWVLKLRPLTPALDRSFADERNSIVATASWATVS